MAAQTAMQGSRLENMEDSAWTRQGRQRGLGAHGERHLHKPKDQLERGQETERANPGTESTEAVHGEGGVLLEVRREGREDAPQQQQHRWRQQQR